MAFVNVAGVLEGTGGIANLVAGFDNDPGARLFYESHPAARMDRLPTFYTEHRFQHLSCSCDDAVAGTS